MAISQDKKEKIKSLTKIFKSSTFYICLVIILFTIIMTKQILKENILDLLIPVLLVELLVEGILIAFLIIANKKSWPIEIKFLILAIGLGILFIIFLPPGEAPDEPNHFRRAYAIAQGELIIGEETDEKGDAGSLLPEEINLINENIENRYFVIIDGTNQPNSGNKTVQNYANTALYNFICYIPQSFAALLGRIFNLPILVIAYLMKICNFIVWVILIYFAIKLIPKFKTAVLFIALLPITLQEATSLAPDALTIGLSIFLISYVLNLIYAEKKVLKKKNLIILYILAIVIGFCKIVYVPLVLLCLLIPKERFGSKKQKTVHLIIIFSLVAILNCAWLVFSAGLLKEFNPGVNSGEQLKYILTNPLNYMMDIYRTINVNLEFWLTNALGMLLGSFTFKLPNILFYSSLIIAILLIAQRNESLKMNVFSRCIFIGVFVAIVGLIFTSLYIQWTAVGAEQIEGIQGRYFLPILLLLPIMLCRNEKDKKKEKSKKYPVLVSENAVLYYSMFVGVIACVTIFAQNI